MRSLLGLRLYTQNVFLKLKTSFLSVFSVFLPIFATYLCSVAQRRVVRALDLRSTGRGVQLPAPALLSDATLAKSFIYVRKQYNLVPARAGKVTVGLASHRRCIADNSGYFHLQADSHRKAMSTPLKPQLEFALFLRALRLDHPEFVMWQSSIYTDWCVRCAVYIFDFHLAVAEKITKTANTQTYCPCAPVSSS